MNYEELLNLLKSRTSCRKFKTDPVEDEKIKSIVDAGLWSASAHNLQSQIIIRISDPSIRERLRINTSKIMGQDKDFDPFYGAKEILLVAAFGKFAPYDGSLTMCNMMLASETLGLGSCWVNTAQYEMTFGSDSVLREIFGRLGREKGLVLSDMYVGVGYLAVGYPNEEKTIKERKEGRYFEICT